MLDDVRKAAKKNYPGMIRLRRFFHAYPELAFQEFRTSRKIKTELARLKIRTISLAATGVVGYLRGKKTGPVCAIRSDMDALPIQEKTGLAFASRTPGMMHACGHDFHMATVLGAAMILAGLKDSLKGSIKFIFQPAEEVPPGGAIEMIRAGVLKSPPVKMILGLHTDPRIPSGKIGCREGVMMSEVLDFDLVVKGKGGHGAHPQETVDSIVVASQLINSLQTIVSRGLDPNRPAVLTIGQIEGGLTRNVIAEEVRLRGTIRSPRHDTVQDVKGLLEKISSGVAGAFGASCRIKQIANYPSLINNPAINRIIAETARDLFGKKCVLLIDTASLGGEDFAQYLRRVPGAMFRVGVRNPKVGAIHPWHSEYFNSDETAMIMGSAVLAGTILRFLDEA